MVSISGRTIQSYFNPEPSTVSSGQTLLATLPSSDQTQLPSSAYTSTSIGELAGGLKHVTVTGRILALREQVLNGRISSDIRLILHMTIGDETGVLIVILNYRDKPDPLRLGLLVTVCAREIWSVPTIEYQTSTIYTSIFLGQSAETLVRILNDEDQKNNILCRIPHYYQRGRPLSGLTSLEDFLHDSPPQQPKVLVVVWSLAYKDTFATPRGQIYRVELDVLDTSCRATLILTDVNALSVPNWTAGRTVLLLSVPETPLDIQGPVRIGNETLMHVDPDIEEAKVLKEFASEQMGKQIVKGVFNVKNPLWDNPRVLSTLADLDDSARIGDSLSITGLMYLMIVELDLYGLYRRSKLYAGLCPSFDCNSPVTSPTPQSKCSKCHRSVSLGINPRIVRLLIDETGGISGGQMIWLEEAWHQLLGHTNTELAKCNGEEIKRVEQRLLFLSIVVMFGWSEKYEGRKVCVLKVGSL